MNLPPLSAGSHVESKNHFLVDNFPQFHWILFPDPHWTENFMIKFVDSRPLEMEIRQF